VLTPLALDLTPLPPPISNLSLNLAVVVRHPLRGECFARVTVEDVCPRLLRIPAEDRIEQCAETGRREIVDDNFVWLEDVVAAHLDMLLPGVQVAAAYPFRVTRDANLEIKDDATADLLTTIEAQVGMRHFGTVVRLEVDRTMPEVIRAVLTQHLQLAPHQVYTVDGPLGMASLMELTRLHRPDLKDAPFLPALPGPPVQKTADLFGRIRRHDLLLYHPYDSFMPVVDFVRAAAHDPHVLAIKQTLYRVGANSPVVEALMEARRHRKQVTAVIELQARFDEAHNIAWARALEQAGVRVLHGVAGLKTHAKACLVIRRESDGVRCYVHMSTGNYNTVTGHLYTDLSYFTCDPAIGADTVDLFEALTGYAHQGTYRKLLVAPGGMRQQLLRRIAREVERHRQYGDGYLAFKMNALVDKDCIQALYRASQAGVQVDLQVRGICCLRPGVPGVSEHITVTSIVGRFLEHTRLYYFRNGGRDEVLLGSADLMPRNLDRRVEILFPVEEPCLRQTIIHDILGVHQQDNAQARWLLSDGTYVRLRPASGAPAFNTQEWLLQHWKNPGQRDANQTQNRCHDCSAARHTENRPCVHRPLRNFTGRALGVKDCDRKGQEGRYDHHA
jgi:polyphosphate kinase